MNLLHKIERLRGIADYINLRTYDPPINSLRPAYIEGWTHAKDSWLSAFPTASEDES